MKQPDRETKEQKINNFSINDTQSIAYLVGETAAEKMIAEYALDSPASSLARNGGGGAIE